MGCWRGCLGWGADLHKAQQMPLPLTSSCSSKSRLALTFLVLPFWYLLTRVVPDIFQTSSKTVVCVCVCVWVARICSTTDTYIGTKLFPGAAFTAATIAKHDTLVRADFANFAVDEESMEDLIVDHFQSLERRHSIIIVNVLVVTRLRTVGVTLEAPSLHQTRLNNHELLEMESWTKWAASLISLLRWWIK